MDVQALRRTVNFEVMENNENSAPSAIAAALSWILPATSSVPPYWSQARDNFLRRYWREVDPLKLAVGTFTDKLIGIPFNVLPVDRTVKRHIDQAYKMTDFVTNNSGVGKGLEVEISKAAIDYLTQDKGCFLYIMAHGSAASPIFGATYGVYHLDAAQCVPTGDPDFPVVYTNLHGERHKIHHTRVIHIANMPSPERDLHGVGHSAVTNCINAASELNDISIYMSEKLGSRPRRQIVYIKEGATLEQLTGAIEVADNKMNNEGMRRFSKSLLMAPKNPGGKLDLGTVDLASTPDNFDRMDTSVVSMAQVATAFGLDLNDMAMAVLKTGGGGGNAEIQDRKGRGKGVNKFIEILRIQFDQKLLPEHLICTFDNLDDAQDEHQANIWNLRSTSRQRDLTTGTTTVRVARAKMLRQGEISDEEFEEMELMDGRTADGSDILLLFYSTDEEHRKFLSFPALEDVTDVAANDPAYVLEEIRIQLKDAYLRLEVAPTATVARKVRQAIAALQKLRALYLAVPQVLPEEAMQTTAIDTNVAVEAQEVAQMGEEVLQTDEESAGESVDSAT